MVSLSVNARPNLPRAQTEHVVTLSSLDQSLMRSYVRICLCYPVEDAGLSAIEDRLTTFFISHVRNRPFLAGTVHMVQKPSQAGLLEVRCTRGDVDDWQPIVKHLSKVDFPYSYQELADIGMPPTVFIGNVLNPLPDAPVENGAPTFGVQANFIEGGLFVAVYVHHSVADGTSIGSLISPIAGDSPLSSYSAQTLPIAAVAESQVRQHLSTTNGVSPNPSLHPEWRVSSDNVHCQQSAHGAESRVFSFGVHQLEDLKRTLVQVLDPRDPRHAPFLSMQDCLAALVWIGVSQARKAANGPTSNIQTDSALVMPVNIRSKVKPALARDYFGNACSLKSVTLPFETLLSPLDGDNVAAMCLVASTIRNEISKVDDAYTRSAIAHINSCRDVRETNSPIFGLETDLIYTNLAGLPVETSDLGLGLGPPQWVRKTNTKAQGPGCIVLPKRGEQGLWEIMLQLEHRDMASLLRNQKFMQFVARVTE
jgi:trichothecene 3-O-acetyltransferase